MEKRVDCGLLKVSCPPLSYDMKGAVAGSVLIPLSSFLCSVESGSLHLCSLSTRSTSFFQGLVNRVAPTSAVIVTNPDFVFPLHLIVRSGLGICIAAPV